LVLYSDDVVFGKQGDAKTLVDKYESAPKIEAIIMAQEISPNEVDKYGIISFKENSEDELDNIIEKPNQGEAPSNLASYGRYLLRPSIFKHLVSTNTGKDNELWTVDAITQVAKTKKVVVEKTKGEWLTTGDPESYFKAHLSFILKYESYGNKVVDWVKKFNN